MKGLICYYSNTGNTKLSCEYIANNLSIACDLHNIQLNNKINFEKYDIIGFACYADFGGPSYLMQNFIDSIPKQDKKYSFVFNTFGFIGGKTTVILRDLVIKRGFIVVVGFSLHTPENFPPILAKGLTQKNAPNKKEFSIFNKSIQNLNTMIKQIQTSKEVKSNDIKLRLVDSLAPSYPRTKAKEEMGIKSVNKITCKKCGLCEKVCGYKAIQLSPYPIFNENMCYGCWACYNRCPTNSIYTAKIKNKPQYNRPIPEFSNKLQIK